LTNATFWCLPENYEIIVMNNPEETDANTNITDDGNANGNSQSLLDIRYALQPKFTFHDVATQLDTNVCSKRGSRSKGTWYETYTGE
jgi:hypothetical protein